MKKFKSKKLCHAYKEYLQKINNMLCHKANLNKFLKSDIIQIVFSQQHIIMFEINDKK